MGIFLKQLWTVSGVLVNMVGIGLAFSFPSSLMPYLKEKGAEIEADLDTATRIVSIMGVSSFPGFFIASFLMERYGRRIAHAVALAPAALGWLLIYLATDTTYLLVGRSLCGVTAGATVSLGAVVVGEYTSPENRGMFLNLKTAAVCFGGLIGHVIANFLPWRTVALISLLPSVIALLITATWCESPAWLAANGYFERSEKTFHSLRGYDGSTKKELHDMITAQTERSNHTLQLSLTEKTKVLFNKFTRKDFLKPVVIIFLGMTLLEVSGRHIFPSYAMDIMGEITGSKNQTFYFTLAIDLIITTSAFFSSFLVKVMKRRLLLFGTGFAAITVVFTACGYLFLVSKSVILIYYPWIAVAMFILFFILANLGCTPIPLSFLGELLPLEHRGAGTAVAGVVMSLTLYLSLQVTPFLLLHCKVYGTFAVLGAFMAVLLVILYFMLPETKDRTLQEIEEYFINGKFRDAIPVDDEEAGTKMINVAEVKL